MPPTFPGRRPGRHCLLGLGLLVLVGVPACRLTDVPLWQLPELPPGQSGSVTEIRDVAYHTSEDAEEEVRHHLDLYLPQGKRDFPIVLLVHGGAWMVGDNRCCGLYSCVGEFLAGQGIGAVLPNYRLSPGVHHPEHVKDVARAFAWVKHHIADFGGRPDQIFLVGHSAGAHLAALLATDDTYLRAEGLSTADIKGVIASSGVYRITPGDLAVTFGGESPIAFRFDELTPFRGGAWGWSYPPGLPGIPMTVNVYGPVFGEDPVKRVDASPLAHVRAGLPPFLLFTAQRDLPTLPAQAEEFRDALAECGCSVRLVRVPHRNHNSLFFRAVAPEDPAARTMLDFVRDHCADVVIRPAPGAVPPTAAEGGR
jgi:acetyl esterase/lipase